MGPYVNFYTKFHTGKIESFLQNLSHPHIALSGYFSQNTLAFGLIFNENFIFLFVEN